MAQCGQVQAMVLRTLGIEMCRVYMFVRCFSTLKLLSMYLYNLSIYFVLICLTHVQRIQMYLIFCIHYVTYTHCICTIQMLIVIMKPWTINIVYNITKKLSFLFGDQTSLDPLNSRSQEWKSQWVGLKCEIWWNLCCRPLFQQRRRLRAYSISPRSTFILKMNTVKTCLRRYINK